MYKHVVAVHGHIEDSLAAKLKHLETLTRPGDDVQEMKKSVQELIKNTGNDQHNQKLLSNPGEGTILCLSIT